MTDFDKFAQENGTSNDKHHGTFWKMMLLASSSFSTFLFMELINVATEWS